jgi:hypothetical protein
LEINIGNLYRLSDAKTPYLSPANFSGEIVNVGVADPLNKDKPNVANGSNDGRDLGKERKYPEFCTPYNMLAKVLHPDRTYQSQKRWDYTTGT